MRILCAARAWELTLIRWLLVAFAILATVAPSTFGREKKTLTLTASQARGADAQLDASAATTNFGTATSLNAAARSGTGQASRGIIQFDLSSFSNVGVKRADMSLTVTQGGNKNGSYEAHRVTSLWTESAVTWNNRVAGTPWTTVGGDYSATITSAVTINAGATGTFTWGLTADVQSWYSGTQNFGHVLLDVPSSGNDPNGILFNSREATSNQPQLALTFLQQVSNLKATAGNGSVSLTWANPTTMSGSTSLEGYVGVLILRQVDKPVSATSIPADGTTYSTCSTIGSSNDVVVFVDSSSATSFTDNGVCSALSNDHVYSYKVFVVDAAHNYSTECSTVTSGSGACASNASAIVPEVSAVPSATATSQAVWVFNTLAGSLSAPGVDPSASIVSGSNTLLFDVSPQTGIPVAPPVSVGGAISGRPTLIDSLDDSIAQNVMYVPAQDNFVYAVNTDTGALAWLVNPASVPFVASAGIQAKAFSTSSYTLGQDIVVVGTHNGSTTSGNKFIALNANTGATVWTYTGGLTGGLFALDVVNAPPAIDYTHNAIWFTSRNGSLVLPQSLWKLNPNTGALSFSANLGASDYSPSLTPNSDVLFVSLTGGALTAVDPVSGSTLGSVNPGDGGLHSTAAVATQNFPYTVVFSTSTKVWAYKFSCATNPCSPGGGTFTLLWGGTSVSNPSAPLTFVGLSKVYVGGGDGKIHELDLATGVDGKQRLLNPTATVGDVGIDVTLSYVMASASDGRIYAFAYPF
jgi:PQQ-like domain